MESILPERRFFVFQVEYYNKRICKSNINQGKSSQSLSSGLPRGPLRKALASSLQKCVLEPRNHTHKVGYNNACLYTLIVTNFLKRLLREKFPKLIFRQTLLPQMCHCLKFST